MYLLYEKTERNDFTDYVFKEEVHLYGCNIGFIPTQLQKQLTRLGQKTSGPYEWHLNVPDSLQEEGQENMTLMIDLKPKKLDNVSLYELMDVYGYSYPGWTPIMLCLRGILIDESPAKYDKKSFSVPNAKIDKFIFSMMYLNGGLKEGHIDGKWITPGLGTTNGVLLWPETLEYFSKKAKEIMSEATSSNSSF